ncbi:formate--tetrahydrofolate ligase, partial [Enterococcus sp. DIV1271a]
LDDLKARLARIVVGYTYDRRPVTAGDLHAEGSLALLLKDAIKPNLVQTIYGTPALIHGGPFANIAHGCNSVLATKTALKLGDYVVTEAGFGADLGGEKFLDIKVPNLNSAPDAIVIVATIRALKMHGGLDKGELQTENLLALEKGFANLKRHIRNMQSYNIPVIVAVNEFVTDTEAELALLTDLCEKEGVVAKRASVWANGAKGGVELAQSVVELIETQESNYVPLYQKNDSIQTKAKAVVQKIYGGKDVSFSKKAENQMAEFEKHGWSDLPICMAKTQYSFSDDPALLGAPEDFTITIREFVPKLGAGFLVALTGDVMTMPGLPKKPAALNMNVTNEGEVIGLF